MTVKVTMVTDNKAIKIVIPMLQSLLVAVKCY